MLLGRYTGKRSLNQSKCGECFRVFLEVQGDLDEMVGSLKC